MYAMKPPVSQTNKILPGWLTKPFSWITTGLRFLIRLGLLGWGTLAIYAWFISSEHFYSIQCVSLRQLDGSCSTV